MAEQSTTRRRVDVVVTNPAGQVLAGQDSHNKTQGRLEIPGGHIEPGESVEQAARREVAEETGYRAKNVRTLRQRPLTEKKPGQDEKTYWRQAQVRPDAPTAPELGADDDALLNPQFMLPAELAAALQRAAQIQSNPERIRDAQKAQAVQKVGHMTPFADNHKVAVNLTGLRAATDAVKARTNLVRRNLGVDDWFAGTLSARKVKAGDPESMGVGPATVFHPDTPQFKAQIEQEVAGLTANSPFPAHALEDVIRDKGVAMNSALARADRPTIYQGGSFARNLKDQALYEGQNPYDARHVLSDLKEGPAQEAFNRWVMVHEGTEAGKHFGDRAFASHISTRPMLNDLNIAATLEGSGAEAANVIRALRDPEVRQLTNIVPGVKRLGLGENRISRHAQKRLQEAYERNLDRRGVVGTPLKHTMVGKEAAVTPFEAGYAYTMKCAGLKTAATATELMLAPLLLGIGGAGAGGASGAMYGGATGLGAKEMGQHGLQAGALGGTALGAGLSGTALLAALASRGRG